MIALISAGAGPGKNPRELLEQAYQTVDSLKDCQVVYRDTLRYGKNPELRASFLFQGKYLRHPRMYYQLVKEAEFNYQEQSGPGSQEIYREDLDLILLLPSAYRSLGPIAIYPEDPKAFGMRGESTKTSGPWDYVADPVEMAKKGNLSVSDEKINGRECLRFEVVQDPGTYYWAGINRIRLYLDPKTYLPLRIERFAPDQNQPVVITEYLEFNPNTGLDAGQIKFQGLKNPVSLIRNPSADEIEALLKPIARQRLKDPAPDPQTILAGFQQALGRIQDYRADLTVRFKYHRLRLYRADRFAYHRDPYWFTLVTTEQKANYILLNHSAGSSLWFSPADKNLHLIGGGVQKVLGEQTFYGNDYKFISTLGDNPYQLDWFSLDKMIRENFLNDRARSWLSEYQGNKMWEAQLERGRETPLMQPGRINLVIEPQTGLPRVLELSGYDDPKALMAMTIDNYKINLPLKPGEAKF